jgi:hypothetical protein
MNAPAMIQFAALLTIGYVSMNRRQSSFHAYVKMDIMIVEIIVKVRRYDINLTLLSDHANINKTIIVFTAYRLYYILCII